MVALLKTRDILDDLADLIFYNFNEKVFIYTFFFGTLYNVIMYIYNLPFDVNQPATLQLTYDTFTNLGMSMLTAPLTVANGICACILFLCPWLPFTSSQLLAWLSPLTYVICMLGACKWYFKYSFRLC